MLDRPVTQPVAPARRAPPPVQPRQVQPTATSYDIDRIEFAGHSRYADTRLQETVTSLKGKGRKAEDIENARVAILNLYRQDGYVYTAVAASEPLADRVVTFTVTEGYIKDIYLSDDIGPAGAQIFRFLDHLKEAGYKPLRAEDLEHWMLMANDIPGVTARAVLRPSTDVPGELTLIAEVTYKRYSGIISADNRAYQFSGPNEGLASIDVNGLTGFGDRTTLTFFHSFDQTQIFGQASEEFFVPLDSLSPDLAGLKLKFYGGAGNSEPGGPLAVAGYVGLTKVFGGAVSLPLIRQRDRSLNVSAMFDALEGQILNNGVRTYDSLRVARVGVDFAFSDDIWLTPMLDRAFGKGATDRWDASNSISVRLSQGIEGLGASSNGSPTAPRPGEKINFIKASADIARTQALVTWPSRTLSYKLEVAGQMTGDVLPSAEKFALGGNHFNRGYYGGEVTGDSGVVATAELLFDTPLGPEIGPMKALGSEIGPYNPKAQFFTFFDFGQTWESRPTDAAHTLRSVGVGMRFFPFGDPKLEIDLEAVKRLQLFPQGGGVSPVRGEAFYWQLAWRF